MEAALRLEVGPLEFLASPPGSRLGGECGHGIHSRRVVHGAVEEGIQAEG